MIEFPLPILGFAAWSGTGKTTLLTQLIPLLTASNLRVALIKHAHHSFSIDQPGKDSYRLREAGASQVVIASSQCIASIMDMAEDQKEPVLQDALAAINTQRLDLILVEGFKQAAIPKIELHRQALGKPYLHPNDELIIALAEDVDVASHQSKNQQPTSSNHNTLLPHLDLNQPAQLAEFIQQWLKQ